MWLGVRCQLSLRSLAKPTLTDPAVRFFVFAVQLVPAMLLRKSGRGGERFEGILGRGYGSKVRTRVLWLHSLRICRVCVGVVPDHR